MASDWQKRKARKETLLQLGMCTECRKCAAESPSHLCEICLQKKDNAALERYWKRLGIAL
jgi:hypothetical protein